MDLVTRISRSVSVWFQTPGTSSPSFQPAVVEPLANEQPAGTSLEIAFRGAVVAEPAEVRENATRLDIYGDHYEDPESDRSHDNEMMVFLPDGGAWHEDIQAIDGAPYYQVRVSFIANTESGITPELSALAVAWRY
jgi:hypothetical protein